MSKYSLVIIMWQDHCSYNKWHELSDIEDGCLELGLVASVGWLVKETKDAYYLASTMSDDFELFGTTYVIGKGMTVKKVVLKKGKRNVSPSNR